MLSKNPRTDSSESFNESPVNENLESNKDVFGYTALMIGALCIAAEIRYGTINPVAALTALTLDTM